MSERKKRSIIWTFSKETLESAVSESLTIADVQRKLGFEKVHLKHYKTLKKRFKVEGISTDHFTPEVVRLSKVREVRLKLQYDLESRLVKGINTNNWVKARLLKEGYLRNGEPLTLQLDHIDGDNTNNLQENLRILCPNCHSQTDTWSGRNQKKEKQSHKCDCGQEIGKGSKNCLNCSSVKNRKVKDRPSKEELLKMVKETSFVEVGRRFGVSDNAIRKWLK